MRILAIDNDLIAGMSGGDMHAIKAAQHWAEENDVFFLSSKYGCSYIENTPCKPIVCETPLHLDQRLNIYATLSNILMHILRVLAALFICLRIRHPIKVIVSSSHYPGDVIPTLLLRFTNRKSKVVVYHHGISIPPEHGVLLRSLSVMYNYFGTLLAIHFADLVFIINRSTEALLLHLGVKPEKMETTSNGLNIEDLSSVVGGKSFDACFIGRLVRSKGTSDLVKVWKKVCEKRKNARLAIAGDGPEKERINDLIMKMGLKNNITLLGWISEDEIYEILKSSKVFLFPSHLESWGIAVAEAMASGLPVVAYDLPIYREVFEDKLITVPLGNVEAMAEKVIFLLENPSVAKEIGEAGREFVRRYDWSIVAERELSAIESLCNQKTR